MSKLSAAHARIHQRIRTRFRINLTAAGLILAGSLLVGMVGYHFFAGLSWIDAFLDASMILSGMGQVSSLHTDGAKLFAGAYAIYCGVVFIATVGLVLAPVVGHALHRFHLDEKD